jgi:methylmalonyl-CoA/ethylmalonyl-CoA epimerase
MFTRLHHVGLVVRRLEDGLALWRDVFGLRVSAEATVQDQGVKAALLPIGRSEIELLEPINPNGGVAKFLEKRGEGLHHLCLETPDVGADLAAARAAGFPLLDEAPRKGLAGMICFLHPKGTRGVLTEFATPPPGSHHHGPCGQGAFTGLALREVTARSRDPRAGADVFHEKLGLARDRAAAAPGIVAAAVTVGGVRLCFVGEEAGAASPTASGWAPTSSRAARHRRARSSSCPIIRRGRRARPARRSAAGDGHELDVARCHGVPIRIARTGA